MSHHLNGPVWIFKGLRSYNDCKVDRQDVLAHVYIGYIDSLSKPWTIKVPDVLLWISEYLLDRICYFTQTNLLVSFQYPIVDGGFSSWDLSNDGDIGPSIISSLHFTFQRLNTINVLLVILINQSADVVLCRSFTNIGLGCLESHCLLPQKIFNLLTSSLLLHE